MKKVTVIGNCQAQTIADVLRTLLVDAQIDFVRLPGDMAPLRGGKLKISELKTDRSNMEGLLNESQLILLQNGSDFLSHFETEFPSALPKIRFFPRINFSAFHPDMIRLQIAPQSPTGLYHSSIAASGWTQGLSVDETLALFREEVFAELGFFDFWRSAVEFLEKAGDAANLPLGQHIATWSANGVWMHTFNHPKLEVLADLARAIVTREGISFVQNSDELMTDDLSFRPSWSAYPDVAKRLGVPGAYRFKRGQAPGAKAPAQVLNLEEFVRASFKQYAGHGNDVFSNGRLSSPRYQNLRRFLKTSPSKGTQRTGAPAVAAGTSPYQGLPDHQFWRRAIEKTPLGEVDPVVRSSFTLARSDKVATAGSCFAQHIARTLVKNGFNYYVPERADDLEPEEAQRRNFGVFSARFGNLYTTRQLLQLFDRAYGNFRPMETAWRRSDGRLVDPFRPQIEPEGFATVEELDASRAEHFAAVREMFETLDVFVFTLGLTEAWRSRIDGAVYPLAPGVVAGELAPERHEFVNFSAAEVTADMQGFVGRLRSVNPHAKIILTVSPVPLIATYEDRHVLVSTTYSKAALRVAAEEICQRNPRCAYFPSFEIITGSFTKCEYFESDLRSVTPQGVDHVMRLFMKHYGSEATAGSLEDELMRENAAAAEVVCDEEAIDV